MKNFLYIAILIPSLAFANGANVGYSSIGDSDVTLGALSASYEWNHENNWSTELGFMLGINDDSYTDVDNDQVSVEIDNAYFAKFKYNINDKFYAGITIADITLDATVNVNGTTMSGSGSDTQKGLGLGYRLTKNFEISFDKLDDVDSLNFQYKF
tara:strand:+ start:402 stop:866 length:465 start_codon:yes stop_codon:yes gene_type:complete